ncbi:MAG: hypothetical protein GKR77_06535 [Legionellales bacterium]|nr:hypothetical protein [Legionellales bacterium]
MTVKTLIQCEVTNIKPLTDTVIQVEVLPQQPFHYQAGQYTYIVTNDGCQMPFSIANAPLGAKQLEFHIRHASDSDYSRYLLAQIKQQQNLVITAAEGECVYDNPQSQSVILLAGGTGFAPIKAIIEQVLSQTLSHSLYLYWGARRMNDLYLPELAQHWQRTIERFHYQPVLSEPDANWTGQSGWVHEAVVQRHTDLTNWQVYAAGPPEMIQRAYQSFTLQGLSSEQMHSDGL